MMMAELATAAMLSVGSMDCPHYDLVPKDFDANIQYREEMYRMAGTDPSAAAQLNRMCSEDLMFYINTFCWTYDPRKVPSVIPFITYEFQDENILEIADCIQTGHDFAMPKSRDMGASWMGLSVFEWFWHFRSDLSFLLISRNEDYVDKRGNPKALFWKIDFLHQNQPRWMLPSNRWLGFKDPNRKLLHMKNSDTRSVIDGESTTGDAGRGDRRTAMFIDEHAAFELNDGFRVLKASRDTTNCRGFNSTPQGAHNAFYEVVHNTSAKVLRLHWADHPEKALGLYTTNSKTGKVKLLDDFRGYVNVMRKGEKGVRKVWFPDEYEFVLDQDNPKLRSPWYDDQCERCANDREIAQELDIDFIGSDFPFFDPRFVEMMIKKYCRSPLLIGDIEYDRDTMEPKRFVENPKGSLHLWVTLDGKGRPPSDRKYVLGSDVSAGTGASNSVTSIYDRKTGEKVGVYRNPFKRPTSFSEYTLALAYWFNKGYMVWDASGPTGKTFTQRVIQAGYGNIYYRRNEKKVTQKISDEPGYYLNPQARESLLEDYRSDLADVTLINRSETGMLECLQFIRKPDGMIEHSAAANAQDPSGAKTAHGDEVISDALAGQGLRERKDVEKSEEPEEPVGSLAWRMKMKREEARVAQADGLGTGW